MEKVKHNQSDNALYVFKPKIILGSLITIIWCAILVGIVSLLFAPHESVKFILVATVIMFVICLIYAPFMVRRSIRFYENGIEYRMGNYHVFSEWENLDHLESRSKGNDTIEGIVTKESFRENRKLSFLEKCLRGKEKRFIVLSRVVTIPTRYDGLFHLRVDLDKLLNTEFGRLLYKYAPHLFEEGKMK